MSNRHRSRCGSGRSVPGRRKGHIVILTDDEKRMLDGEQGKAVQKAMDLLVRYGDVLGAERFVDIDNVCGANIFGPASRRCSTALTRPPGSASSRSTAMRPWTSRRSVRTAAS